MISDPKAVRHVYASSHSFVRQKHSRNLLKMLFGPGLIVVNPHDHKRQRKVMQPAFGNPQLRDLFPVFIRYSQKVRPSPVAMHHTDTVSKLVQVLKREIEGDSNRQSLEMNIYDYTTRATLDVTGEGESSPHLLPSHPFYRPKQRSSIINSVLSIINKTD
jgi:hypothetical protein